MRIKPKDFARLLGISIKVLKQWEKEGILTAKRDILNRRYYTYNQYLKYNTLFGN